MFLGDVLTLKYLGITILSIFSVLETVVPAAINLTTGDLVTMFYLKGGLYTAASLYFKIYFQTTNIYAGFPPVLNLT